MKKFDLIIVTLFLICGPLFSQSRFPINASSVWRIDHIRNGVSNEIRHEQGDEIFKYFIDGDTAIQSKTYFKVFKTGTLYLEEPLFYEHQYAFALRDENNKFFMVKKNQTKEDLLYNYNATVDDTILVPSYGEFEEKVVSSVDSLPDGRRIIHCHPRTPIIGCGDQYIIEGIGGSGGLPEGPACNHAWTGDNHLVCFMQDGVLKYHDNNFDLNCEISNKDGSNSLINSTCVWRVDKQSVSGSGSVYEKLNYFFNGDTIIASAGYLKLYKAGYKLSVYEDESYASGYYGPLYAGALRESEECIYFIPQDEEAEVMLYNFGMQEGENIDGIIHHGQKVFSIDTILENRKVFYLSENKWGEMIMEGIGSGKGLLESTDENSYLVCFLKNNTPIFHMETGSECLLTPGKDFLDCSIVNILPEQPTEEDEVKAIIGLCSEVSYNHPKLPEYRGKQMKVEENIIKLGLYYDYDDESNSDTLFHVKQQYDTLSLGYLKSNWYSLEIYIHAIRHNDDHTDTTFYDKTLFQSFSVSVTNGIQENQNSESRINIYPVPARDYVNIETDHAGTGVAILEIFDLLGVKVMTLQIEDLSNGKLKRINVSNLNRGVYAVRITDLYSIITKKIILE